MKKVIIVAKRTKKLYFALMWYCFPLETVLDITHLLMDYTQSIGTKDEVGCGVCVWGCTPMCVYASHIGVEPNPLHKLCKHSATELHQYLDPNFLECSKETFLGAVVYEATQGIMFE